MNKKEYIIALLNKITDEVLPVRKDIILLIQSGVIGDDFIDVLLKIFQDAQKNTQKAQGSLQLQKSIEVIHKIKQMEQEDRQNDSDDILELDRMLNSI